MTTLKTLALAAAATVAALPALAQTNPYARQSPQPRDAYGSYRTQSPGYFSPRAAQPYQVSPGYSGTIRWNTPNADGNFGGPGGGGSSGSPGG